MRRWLWLCVVLPCVGAAASARAYEDQLTFGLGAGYAHAASDALPRNGLLFDVSASAGLNRNWTARGRASYALHPHDAPLHALWLGGDLIYMIDILEVVPYFGGGAGAVARMRGDADPTLDAELHLALGVDYLISRDLGLELEVRPYMVVTELERDLFYFAISASAIWFFDD